MHKQHFVKKVLVFDLLKLGKLVEEAAVFLSFSH